MGVLLVSEESAKLFVDPRYISIAQTLKAFEVIPLAEKANHLPCADKNEKIGFISKRTSVSEYLDLPLTIREFLVPVDALIGEIRSIKDPQEIDLLKRAALISGKALAFAQSHLKEGITEKDLASLYLSHAISLGASAPSFSPIVAFGKNSAFPHHRADMSTFNSEIVLYDVGVMANNYASDMTRCDLTYCNNALLKEDYQIIKEAYQIAFSLAVIGAKVGDLDEAVRAHFRKTNREQLFTHSLGHGVGLEVHEFPRLHYKGPDAGAILKENMVITLEPALYRPGLGGIRLENTVIITANGPQSLNPELSL